MSETVKLILSLSLSGSILALIMFTLKPFVKHRLPKSIQYYMWIVVLLRFIIPFSFEGSVMNNMFYNNSPETRNYQNFNKPIADTGKAISSSPLVFNAKENVIRGEYINDTDHSRYLTDLFNQYILYIWLLGVIIALSINLIGYMRFIKVLRKYNIQVSEEENRIFTSLLNGRNNVRFMRNSYVTTPMLTGILNTCIIIPNVNFDEKQLKNILLHEISHLRRFDVAVKWLTMIVGSVHWFNPLMYFIKKEVNCACELACDENVIKNLSSSEKQSYGDTLISVVAESRKTNGGLQATMYEEKKNLKERLIAIMNHSKKSRIIKVISLVLFLVVITVAIVLGASVGNINKNPPNIYISAEGEKTKIAHSGALAWHYKGGAIFASATDPVNFEYNVDNIIDVTSMQQMIISTQKIKRDKKYKFTVLELKVYKNGKEIRLDSVKPSSINGNLYLQAPKDTGEYIYSLLLDFGDNRMISCGFIVRVDMISYNIDEISKYRTPYIGNSSKVLSLVASIPVPDKHFKQQYISMITSSKPYKLTVYYEPKEDSQKISEWPINNPESETYSNIQKNALVLFSMIDNLDSVTFAFRDSQSQGSLDKSKYNTSFTFSRDSIQEKYGPISTISNNLNLLKNILEGKIK